MLRFLTVMLNKILIFSAACALYISYKIYQRRSRLGAIARIRGPRSKSFLFGEQSVRVNLSFSFVVTLFTGNLEELLKSQAGEVKTTLFALNS